MFHSDYQDDRSGNGFHNKTNTLDFAFGSKGDEEFRIGIQIEGNQFRRFVKGKNDSNNPKHVENVFSKSKDEWFDGGFYGRRNTIIAESIGQARSKTS